MYLLNYTTCLKNIYIEKNYLERKTVIVFLFLSIAISILGHGQTTDSVSISKKMHNADYSQCGHNFIITAGINRTNYTSYEFSVGRSYSAEYNASIPETFSLYALGAEILSDNATLVIAPKLSCELDFIKSRYAYRD
ncbi:MAG: hypothetical protein JWO44_1893 [Bacteroidetes bacterium]|nr:hypothetical protein [Bacteroidota bacterium]